MNLPAPREPDVSLQTIDGKAWTTSLDVAEKFGKLHKDVLKAVRALECSEEFMRRNFAPHDYVDGRGNTQPAYRMTRDGFTFLAMGFSGPAAGLWKERYIQAFNALEHHAVAVAESDRALIVSLLERNQQTNELLASNVLRVGHEVAAVNVKVDTLSDEVVGLKRTVIDIASRMPSRRKIASGVKQMHLATIARMSSLCPCCHQKTAVFEFDHFYQNSQPDFKHTWPLCAPCHSGLTAAKVSRQSVRSRFDAYQEFAAQYEPQMGLFSNEERPK